MKIYFPVHTNKWEVWEEESDDMRFLPTGSESCKRVVRWKEKVGFYGTIYNADCAFTNEKAAWDWINKNYSEAWKHQFKTFKEVKR